MNQRPNFFRRKLRNKKGQAKRQTKADEPERQDSKKANPEPSPLAEKPPTFSFGPGFLAVSLAVAAALIWSYWQTFQRLVEAWENEPDYSHGYLVIPFALYFLWARRDSAPGLSRRFAWVGAILITLSIGIRYFAAMVFIDAIDAWSMLIFITGAVLLITGWRFLCWASPSIAFLFFMIPLPYKAERFFSLPLQKTATKLSGWALQFLGQPAIAEGNTILLGDHTLEVEQACSGLRIFVGIVALAFAYLVLVRRSWLERSLLILSIVPIALAANATRIVATGLLYQYTTTDIAHKFSHDLAGWLMIPFAAALFGLFLLYLSKLIRDTETVELKRRPAT